MKFFSFRRQGEHRIGAISNNQNIIDLTLVTGCRDLGEALRRLGPEALVQLASADGPALDVSQIQCYRPAVADPLRILCIGLNYEEHRAETGREHTARPTVFLRLPSSQLGHMESLVVPSELPEGLDYEGEIAIVIGRSGRRITLADAWKHVFGYAPYNDGSARAWQAHSTQWTAEKNFPMTGAFGPYVVTADEVGDDPRLTLTTRLNGQVMQQADTSMMIFSIPELVHYVSTFTPLEPGDVIVTGIPGGIGVKRSPPVLLRAGDVVEVEVSSIGVLRNTVIGEAVPGALL